MGRGKGRPFPKGQSGNPKGRPPLPDDVRKIRAAAAEEIIRVAAELLRLPASKLVKIADWPETPALEAAIAKTLKRAVLAGDYPALEAVISRVAGPVPKAVELTGKDGEPFRPFAGTSSEEIVAALRVVQLQLRSTKCNPTRLPSSAPSPASPSRSSRRGSPSES